MSKYKLPNQTIEGNIEESIIIVLKKSQDSRNQYHQEDNKDNYISICSQTPFWGWALPFVPSLTLHLLLVGPIQGEYNFSPTEPDHFMGLLDGER